ncbi:GPW/gp25 family protein [Achromobacter mucicolens]|uniref:GPW/gp25 family protein n=1 Tax=Achromobacter mucicolens TaxID=1389922 RepID=UPI0020A31039|nr:GPW/gp25 family protein [Achromobacter mucicolens]MCP2517037.1 GPW/gp25 family protein [Achromobacter mucicolens]
MSYLGMNAATGLRISGRDHLAQSINKVLQTPLATRVRRRAFGSKAADMIDSPANGAAILQLYAVAATALMLWEPRLRIRSMSADVDAERPGRVLLNLHGEADTGDRIESVSITTTLSA